MKYKKKQISDEEHKKIFRLLKKKLSKEPILFVYVFGSFITAQKFNDIDIAVFFDINRISQKSLMEYEIELEQRLSEILKGYEIEVKALNNAPVSFKYQVIKTGLPLLIQDDDVMVDFETLTYSMYFDFAPFRRTYLKEVLGAKV